MKKPISFLLFAACLLSLTACVSREQADTTLAKGCEAGVKVLLPEEYEIKKVKGTDFKPSVVGNGYRHVTLHTITLDGWLEIERDYTCIFEESFGIFHSHHTGSIYQIKLGDERVIGKSGNEILGSSQDFLKLTEAIRKAMYDY